MIKRGKEEGRGKAEKTKWGREQSLGDERHDCIPAEAQTELGQAGPRWAGQAGELAGGVGGRGW